MDERVQQEERQAQVEAEAAARGVQPPPPGHISLHNLARILGMVETQKALLLEVDPCPARVEAKLTAIEEAMADYKRLHEEVIHHQRQTTMTRYLQRQRQADDDDVVVIDVEEEERVARDVQEVLREAPDFEGFPTPQ